jgi:hypothetical protein
MARNALFCPPGFLCMSNGILYGMIGFVFVCIMVLLYIRNTPAEVHHYPQRIQPSAVFSDTVSTALSPQMPAPPTVIQIGRGGDDRYSRAPQPLRDWLAPPEFPPRGGIASIPINMPTQGLPESFQSVGMMNVSGKMLPLYGRRTAGSSDRWNYYTRTDTYNPVPIPLKYQRRDCMDDTGCTELYSGENVKLEGTGEDGKVTIYKIDGPKYIPGLI